MNYSALVTEVLAEKRQVLEAVNPDNVADARIVLFTAHPENEHGKTADLCVRIPGQIFGGSQEVNQSVDGFVAGASSFPVHR